MKKILVALTPLIITSITCLSVNAGVVHKSVDGTKKGVRTAVDGTKKGVRTAVDGTKKGVRSSIDGTKKVMHKMHL